MSQIVKFNDCTFEVLTNGEEYVGIGKVCIGDTLIRSGRLPINIFSQSFTGYGFSHTVFKGVEEKSDEVRINFAMHFTPLDVKLMRDHSMDPIHETADWDKIDTSRASDFSLVIEPGQYENENYKFKGFKYHYEFSGDMPLFYILERSSWEIDGDILGSTVYNQSACSAPVVEVKEDTFWTTEGELFFLDEASYFNRIMTHNLPRWADHQWYDYQFKGDKTLIGMFDNVDLIRTVLRREKGKPELKCFDKYIFDETTSHKTVAKSILINEDKKTVVDNKNLWTWIFDETADAAREEYGLREIAPVPIMGDHHWTNFTIETYYKDIVPACANAGVKFIFAENFKKSDAAEPDRLKAGNMCTSHDYVMSDYLGGKDKFKEYIDRTHELGIKTHMWTNTYVSLNADINLEQRDESGRYMAMEDTRTKYAGAYTMVSSNLDLKNPDVREYYVNRHVDIIKETGLDGYFIDSHYNLFFMPVNFKTGHPRTSWKESLWTMREIQDRSGGEWSIESFGPFGMNIHGHSDAYDMENIFACYTVGVGNNYVTVPVPGAQTDKNSGHDVHYVFYQLAYKSPISCPLFIDGVRIDEVFTDEHKLILEKYHELVDTEMERRYIQEDNSAVLYHNEAGNKTYIWNFAEREAVLKGDITDLMTGEKIVAGNVKLLPRHIYMVEGVETFVKI